jgi:methyl-accepting chemotaxis protein
VALQALRAIKPIVDREVPRALDKFYQRAQATPETRAFFADQAMVERAKAAQLAHWRRMAAGEFDGIFMETARRVGQTHARIGLPPKWYAAGYAIIMDHVLSAAVVEAWPKSALRGGAFGKSADVGAALSALARIVLLDFDLATSAYIDALDERRRAAEEIAAQAAKEATQAVDACREAFAQLAARNLNCRLSDGLAVRYQVMTVDFNRAVSGLHEALSDVAACIDTISSATSQIASASQDLSSRTEHEASSLEQSSAAIEEVSGQVDKTAERAQAAKTIVAKAGEEARESNDVVAKAIGAMERIEKSSSDIGKIIGAIDEIAFQTNLLALNAGVEAARAGDAGRGFAVVASEVRGLAQRSAEAAKEIKALVATATSEVEGGVRLVTATGEALARIVVKVAEMNSVVAEIFSSAQQQAASLGEIKQAVGELSHGTQQNAAMAEESTAASASLAKETATLADLVAQFNLGPARRASVARLPAERPAPPASARRPAPPRAASASAAAADWKQF